MTFDELLAANPKAKADEDMIRETVEKLRSLRASGLVGGESYNLASPYGSSNTHLSPAVASPLTSGRHDRVTVYAR